MHTRTLATASQFFGAAPRGQENKEALAGIRGRKEAVEGDEAGRSGERAKLENHQQDGLSPYGRTSLPPALSSRTLHSKSQLGPSGALIPATRSALPLSLSLSVP